VASSTACTEAIIDRSALRGDCPRNRSTDATTSAAVTGLPSWNLTPLRRWKVYVLPSVLVVQRSASWGATS
jgi:hypothetical protein